MSGQIWVESVEGQGSSFFFTCVLDIFEKDNITLLDQVQSIKEVINEDLYELLIVEDDEISRIVIEKLANQRGWHTTSAKNGEEAVEKYKRSSFNAILMDVQMPIMDGYEATKIIRQLENKKSKQTPIIAMTAHAIKGDREKCIEAGMNDYMTKPIDAKEFHATVDKWAKKNIN